MTLFKTFANNQLLTAQEINDYLMGQVVVTVATVAARDALVVHDGLTVWITADKRLQIYSTALGWLTVFEDTGWLKVGDAATFAGSSLGAGVTHYALSGFTGLWARRRNGIVWIVGGITGTVAAAGTICTLPAGWRPTATPGDLLRIPMDGTSGTSTRTMYSVDANGVIKTTAALSGNSAIALTSWPVN